MGDGLTRRQLAKLTAVVAAAGSVLLGWVVDAFDVSRPGDRLTPEVSESPGESTDELPDPTTVEGTKRVGTAIGDRRSRRAYGSDPLRPAELGQLLWAAQGITEHHATEVDFRTAPSAGATYPLEVFAVIDEPGVTNFDAGIYHYEPDGHTVELLEEGRFQEELAHIAIDQEWMQEAPLCLVITGVDQRTTQRYGSRGRRRYVPMEAGHAGENVYLQAESLGLATVAVGAFRDSALRELLGVGTAHRPLYIFPVGRRA